MNEVIQTLKANIENLPKQDRGFAQSLVDQFEKKNQLSDKQWFWADKLSARASGVPDFTVPDKVELGSFIGVMELFQKANANLKYPRIVLQTEKGKKLALSLAGQKSSHAGSVSLTDGGAYDSNTWYGWVDKTGQFKPSYYGTQIKDDLVAILTKLAMNPARVAAEHGKFSGLCCFCNSPLTDPKSTEVGYGPVCAKQWGLPWGKPVGKA